MLILQAVRALQPDTRKDKDKELCAERDPCLDVLTAGQPRQHAPKGTRAAGALTSEVVVGEPPQQVPFIHLQHTTQRSIPLNISSSSLIF